MKYLLTYYSPKGRPWPLLGEEHEGVILREGGIDGLVGRKHRQGYAAVGVPGEVTDPLDATFDPITGALDLVITAHGPRTVAQVWAAFKKSWSTDQTGTLVLDGPEGRRTLPVRLDAAGIEVPARQPARTNGMTLQVKMRSDRGVWSQPISEQGPVVTIANHGDAPINPRLRWVGVGGAVTMPSGAVFQLPATEQPRVVLLDAAESCIVLDTDGLPDLQLWKQVHHVIAEPVPVGATRTFTIPASATLAWDEWTLDPWR